MQSAARAAEKSWRRLLREDDRGGAGLRSDPIHSRSQVGGAGGIIWNTTGDNGISQTTTAALPQKARPSMAGFSTAFRGDTVWKALAAGSWKAGGWDPQLFEACLCRSQTLAQAPTYSHRYPTVQQMREWVKTPVAYRFEYADGLKATMLLMNGLVGDFTFAARIKGESEPLSTLFYLPPNPNVTYSAALMSKAEATFTTGVDHIQSGGAELGYGRKTRIGTKS